MIKYFKSEDLQRFTKGFDSDWIDDAKIITGEFTEITEEEYCANKNESLDTLLDNLDRGRYEVQFFEKVEFDEYDEPTQIDSFYRVVQFVSTL